LPSQCCVLSYIPRYFLTATELTFRVLIIQSKFVTPSAMAPTRAIRTKLASIPSKVKFPLKLNRVRIATGNMLPITFTDLPLCFLRNKRKKPFRTTTIHEGTRNTTKYILTAFVSPCSIKLEIISMQTIERIIPIIVNVLIFIVIVLTFAQ
jgi:hypothetical protein